MPKSPREILEASATIAVVGASRDPSKPGASVPMALKAHGFRVIPINPLASELFGERCYARLEDVPEPIDLVNVFRPSGDAPEIARAAVRAGARALWLQSGIRSEEARRVAEGAGLDYVEDECTGVVRAIARISR